MIWNGVSGTIGLCAGVWLVSCGVMVQGQTAPAEAPAKAVEVKPATVVRGPESVRVFYLSSVTQVNDANEILATIRSISDPDVRIFLMLSENAITVRGNAEQMAMVERLLKELDRPKKTFRLIYTVREMDGGKMIGVQHFAMVLATGGRTVMKQGSRVPVATGSVDTTAGHPQTQFTYLDVGLNVDASIDGYLDGVRLRTKVEQSSAAETHSLMGVDEPVIRQTVLEGTTILTQGKPVVLGSADVSGSTRRLVVEVVLEAVVLVFRLIGLRQWVAWGRCATLRLSVRL